MFLVPQDELLALPVHLEVERGIDGILRSWLQWLYFEQALGCPTRVRGHVVQPSTQVRSGYVPVKGCLCWVKVLRKTFIGVIHRHLIRYLLVSHLNLFSIARAQKLLLRQVVTLDGVQLVYEAFLAA